MKKPGSKVEKIFRFFSLLSPSEWRTAVQLAEDLDVNVRTVYRYVRDLQDAFYPCEVIEPSNEGYRLSSASRFVQRFEVREAALEVVAAGAAADMAPIVEGHVPASSPLFDAVSAWVRTRKSCDAAIWKPLFAALRDGGRLSVEYSGGKTRRVVPLRHIVTTEFSYLVVRDLDADCAKTLRLDRIRGARRAGGTESATQVSVWRAELDAAWGLLIVGKPFTAEVEVRDPALVERFTAGPLHRDQKITRRGKGSLLTMRVHDANEFARHLIRFGDGVRALSPKPLVVALATLAKRTAALYPP